MNVIFTKENLKSYFKEFGHIEEIIIIENENKALILFTHDKAIREILNSTHHQLNKLFKIKKYSKKDILKEAQKPDNLKNKFIDTETLELLKNKRFMSNIEFMEQEKNSTNKKVVIEDKKKSIIENAQNKYTPIINEAINVNMDLDKMEKLIFDKIKNSVK